MTPQEFVVKYYPYAKASQDKKGISAAAILVQAAIESAWGAVCPGNMFFGQKAPNGTSPEDEQLLTTTEYLSDAVHKFPMVLSIVPVVLNGKRMFKYTIKDWFRKYATPTDCFNNHCDFIIQNPRYAKALSVKGNASQFLTEIAKAGYATDPYYAKTCLSVLNSINKYLPTT